MEGAPLAVLQHVRWLGLSWRKYLPSCYLQEDPDIRSDSYITNGFTQWSREGGQVLGVVWV